jgi:hypothetical protein
MMCGEAMLLSEAGRVGRAVTLCCKQWDCDHCRPLLQRKLARLIIDLKPTLFATLTISAHWHGSPEERAEMLKRDWGKIRDRANRKFRTKIDFVAVFEVTDRGEPHLHLSVANCPVRPKIFRQFLRECLQLPKGSPRVAVKHVYGVAGLARYLSKAPTLFAGRQRYWTSRGWRRVPDVPVDMFDTVGVVRATPRTVERMLRAAGYTITGRTPRRIEYAQPP